MEQDIYFIKQAIKIAKASSTPFGALVVNAKEDFITAANSGAVDGPIAHAELNVLQKLPELYFEDRSELTLYFYRRALSNVYECDDLVWNYNFGLWRDH